MKTKLPTNGSRPPQVAQEEFMKQLIAVLGALHDGDSSARLPSDWTGLEGKVAERLNGISNRMLRFNNGLTRLRSHVGEEGKISERMPLGDAVGGWSETLALGADFTGDADHFDRESFELADHAVHELGRAQVFALQGPAAEFERHGCDRSPLATAPITRPTSTVGWDLTQQFEAARDLVEGDDMRLKQIFWNVIKNAVKFTPPSGRITLRTRLDADTNRLVIHVTDTGIGMTADESARIFTAFTQGDHALGGGGRFGGLGLGLAISRMLVQLHAGTITATSPGRNLGCTFTIELPLCLAPAAADRPPGSQSPFGIAVDGQLLPGARALRVLLVEDHEPTCRTLAELLTRRRFQVVSASTVADACAAAAREQSDFVISDVGLPDGNGCELMADLRTRHGLRGVALTGYGMDDDVMRSHAAGFVTHLTKPVSVRALDQALSQLLASHAPAS